MPEHTYTFTVVHKDYPAADYRLAMQALEHDLDAGELEPYTLVAMFWSGEGLYTTDLNVPDRTLRVWFR